MRQSESRTGKGRQGDLKPASSDSPSTRKRARKAGVPSNAPRESPRSRRLPMTVDPTAPIPRNGHAAKSAKVMTHKQLDARLDVLALSPDTFTAECGTLAAELDLAGIALEITDPLSWRKPVSADKSAARVTLSQQFRREVDAMIVLEREPEARLARRIEFARVRFEQNLKEAGMTAAQVLESMSFGDRKSVV